MLQYFNFNIFFKLFVIINLLLIEYFIFIIISKLNNIIEFNFYNKMITSYYFKDKKEFGLTWKCHACNRERPDEDISVVSKSYENSTFNVRYCNDSRKCFDRADRLCEERLQRWKDIVNRKICN